MGRQSYKGKPIARYKQWKYSIYSIVRLYDRCTIRRNLIYVIALVCTLGRGRCRLIFGITTLLFTTRIIGILLVYLERHTPEDGRLIASFADIRRWLAVPVPEKRDSKRKRLWKHCA